MSSALAGRFNKRCCYCNLRAENISTAILGKNGDFVIISNFLKHEKWLKLFNVVYVLNSADF